jgi:arabinofuranosyltransferase
VSRRAAIPVMTFPKSTATTPGNSPGPSAGAAPRLVAALAIAAAALIIVKSAWICDDAFITLRTVDNFVHGFGLRWNVDERVQSFTHPLWLMALTPVYTVTRSAYYTGIVVSLAASLAVVAIYVRRLARHWPAVVLGVLALLSSRAFVDYSTSGLENPLTHLLIVAFLALLLPMKEVTPRRAGMLALLAALGALNRLDTILLFAPALVWVIVQAGPQRRAALKSAALGFAPLAAWLAFALFYFGFALPNTYYAKVSTGVSRPFLWLHGVSYLLNAARTDRLVLLFPLAALVAAIHRRRGSELAAVAGMVFYVGYLMSVGGDFMSGRFFTAPFVMAIGLLGFMDEPWNDPGGRAPAWIAAMILVLGLTAPLPTLLADPYHYGAEKGDTLMDTSGVSDERGYYWPTTALSAVRASGVVPLHPWSLEGVADREHARRVSVHGSVGFYGFFAGPTVHVVDQMALTDPLLARLPAKSDRPRIGHYERRVPAGYLATLESGRNQITDPGVAAYYDRLHEVISAPLFDLSRLRTLVAMNLGRFDKLLDRTGYRRPRPQELTASLSPGTGGEEWRPTGDGPIIPAGGLVIRLREPSHRSRITILAAARGQVRITLHSGGAASEPVLLESRERAPWPTFAVPLDVAAAGYEAIEVEMAYGFSAAALAGLSFSGPPVLLAEETKARVLGREGLVIPVRKGERLETIRVTTDPGQRVTVQPEGQGATPELRLPGARSDTSAGVHVIDTAAAPLAGTIDRVWLGRVNDEPVTVRSVELASSAPSP